MSRFYDKPVWQKARSLQLHVQPLCEHCLKVGHTVPATEVDHIVRMSEGGAALDPDNLQSLCKPCHSRKTRHEMTGTQKPLPGCDENGMPLDPSHPWNQGGHDQS
ncbi:MAG: HNH endonuclease signature motif containing protein [Candidatus Thiodiazotropha sp.]